MRKKKKSVNIKLNNKAREYFNGLPFDEGVATLDYDNLLGLTMLLSLPSTNSTAEMIKAIRRVWSESSIEIRTIILNFLTDKTKYDKNHTPQTILTEKTALIVDLLSQIPHTQEEEHIILNSFVDSKHHKVTLGKLQNKLLYMRQKKYFNIMERRLDITFNATNQMEFYHSFIFRFSEYDFNKILVCISPTIEFDSMDEMSEDEIALQLIDVKNEIISKRQSEIDNFILQLISSEHKYLTQKEMMAYFKNTSPDNDLLHTPIAFSKIETIIRNINNNYFVSQSTDHIIVEKEKKHHFHNSNLFYDISLSFTKEYIFKCIWDGQDLLIGQEFISANDRLLDDFNQSIDELKDEMTELASGLRVENDKIFDFILQFLEPQITSSRSLRFKEKTKKRVLYHWNEYIKPFKEKQKREMLLAKTIRDFKQLFPLARSYNRKIIFHAGPTNSGKTYEALKQLSQATTGSYLAPLRLLALEGYENLREQGVNASLITGEEEILHDETTHISSTIEMMNSNIPIDLCVIDEIQMINDRDRGWAWANALIGVPAKTVILTGSIDALNAITELVEYLGEELEIVRFQRKNPLEVMDRATPLSKIEKGTALVAFSRKEVLSLKQQLSNQYSVSVIYGNLSPEVRREEARRFRDKESDVLVATDAIAMGLNLPIKTLIFTKDNKFDGLQRRELGVSEVLQISGRAGRFGFEEKGYIGALDSSTLKTISKKLESNLADIQLPVSVMANMDHILLIGEILETERLSEILEFFVENMEFDGPFVAANIDSMLEVSIIVDEYKLDLKTKFHLSCAPVTLSSPYIESVLHRYIRLIESDKPVPYIPPRDMPHIAQTNEMLLNAEDRVREISLYLWLSFRFPDKFTDTALAISSRVRLNKFIENSLKDGHFVKECHRCGKILDFSYRFSICESCHSKGKRGTNYSNRRYRTRQ